MSGEVNEFGKRWRNTAVAESDSLVDCCLDDGSGCLGLGDGSGHSDGIGSGDGGGSGDDNVDGDGDGVGEDGGSGNGKKKVMWSWGTPCHSTSNRCDIQR